MVRDLRGGVEDAQGQRLVKVIQLLFCPFSGDDCLELESSMAERSRLRAPDLGR